MKIFIAYMAALITSNISIAGDCTDITLEKMWEGFEFPSTVFPQIDYMAKNDDGLPNLISLDNGKKNIPEGEIEFTPAWPSQFGEELRKKQHNVFISLINLSTNRRESISGRSFFYHDPEDGYCYLQAYQNLPQAYLLQTKFKTARTIKEKVFEDACFVEAMNDILHMALQATLAVDNGTGYYSINILDETVIPSTDNNYKSFMLTLGLIDVNTKKPTLFQKRYSSQRKSESKGCENFRVLSELIRL